MKKVDSSPQQLRPAGAPLAQSALNPYDNERNASGEQNINSDDVLKPNTKKNRRKKKQKKRRLIAMKAAMAQAAANGQQSVDVLSTGPKGHLVDTSRECDGLQQSSDMRGSKQGMEDGQKVVKVEDACEGKTASARGANIQGEGGGQTSPTRGANGQGEGGGQEKRKKMKSCHEQKGSKMRAMSPDHQPPHTDSKGEC